MSGADRPKASSAGAAQSPTAVGPGATYCDHCGTPVDSMHPADHATCRRLRELEPPRYCSSCRRRLIVQVLPRGWSARCSAHGEIAT